MEDNVKLAKELLTVAKTLVADQKRINMWCKQITTSYASLMEALDQAVCEGANELSEPKKKFSALRNELQNAVFKSYKK